jgi:predicted dehydrogenase
MGQGTTTEAAERNQNDAGAVHLITCDPGHFHAALVQKEMAPGVSPVVHVYAPLGPDLLAHLGRVASFNARRERPTAWQLEVHAGPEPLRRMLAERPGNVVVFSGRNRGKIDAILAAVEAGLNVLADKPWVIDPDDLPKLKLALDRADEQGLIAYDVMTERYEITSRLQRELVNDPETFGTIEPGTPEEPGVFMDSAHFLLKMVSGAPNRRPGWFFDVGQLGEGLSDVGTHLVDLVAWGLFPGQAVTPADVRLLSAKRWPTVLTRADFVRVTGLDDFPGPLPGLTGDRLDYFCNTLVSYALRGVHVTLNVRWDYEAAPGEGDTHFAVFRGTRSAVEVRQGQGTDFKAGLVVVPRRAGDRGGVRAALERKVAELQGAYPGVGVEEAGPNLRLTIPDHYHDGHEAHFGCVLRQFLRYLDRSEALPAWEKPNMLAKYHVTTHGVALARAGGAR